MSDRPATTPQRLPGMLLIVGAAIAAVGNGLHPHVAEPDGAAALAAIAANGAWAAVHLAIIVSILLIIGGLVGYARSLRSTAGAEMAALGVAAALVGGALVTVSTSIDGFAMKALATQLAAVPAADAQMTLRIALAVKEVDFAVWSIGMLVLFGGGFGCLGVAGLLAGRSSARLGWLGIVGAAGSALAALIQIAAGGETQDAESMFLAASMLLTVWVFVLGVRLWAGDAERPAVRRGASTPSAA